MVKLFVGDPDTTLSVKHFSNHAGKRGEKIRTKYGYMLQKPETTEIGINVNPWGRAVNSLLEDERQRRGCECSAKAYARRHDMTIVEKNWEQMFTS